MQIWFLLFLFIFCRRELATLTSFVYLLNYSDDLVNLVLIWLLRLTAKVSSVPQSSKIGFLRARDTAVSGESKYYGLCNRMATIQEAPWAFLLLWNECCTGKIASTKKPACFLREDKRPREDDRAYDTTGQAREVFFVDRFLEHIIQRVKECPISGCRHWQLFCLAVPPNMRASTGCTKLLPECQVAIAMARYSHQLVITAAISFHKNVTALG